jgi:hypothetical protein
MGPFLVRWSYFEIAKEMGKLQAGPDFLELRGADLVNGDSQEAYPLAPKWLMRIGEWAQALFRFGAGWGRDFNEWEFLDQVSRLREGLDSLDRKELPRRRAVAAQGQHLVDRWKEEGWVTGQVHVSLGGAFVSGASAIQYGPHREGHHDLRLNVRANGNVPNLGVGESLMITSPHRLWLTLGHEAAHAEFMGEAAPFRPSSTVRQATGLTPSDAEQQIQAINTHLFGPASTGDFGAQLNEAFADVYGAMMTLRSAFWSPAAVFQVKQLSAVRKGNHDYHRFKYGPWRNGQLDLYQITGPALDKLLDEPTIWHDFSPSQMKQRALELVSDAWLEVAHQEYQHNPSLLNAMRATWDMKPWFPKKMVRIAKFEEPETWLDRWRPMLANTLGFRLAEQGLAHWRQTEEGQRPFVPPMEGRPKYIRLKSAHWRRVNSLNKTVDAHISAAHQEVWDQKDVTFGLLAQTLQRWATAAQRQKELFFAQKNDQSFFKWRGQWEEYCAVAAETHAAAERPSNLPLLPRSLGSACQQNGLTAPASPDAAPPAPSPPVPPPAGLRLRRP